MGLQDALGASTPQGAGYEIGAFEYRRVLPDSASAFLRRPFQQTDGSWRIEFLGALGRSYRIEGSADLRAWSPLGNAVEISPGQFAFVSGGTSAARFYRAVVRGVPGI
jgi:hypothetical protein